jgi:hypothetical protein
MSGSTACSHPRRIFISYRTVEPELALQLAADLRNEGVHIWLDRLDGIRPGMDWRHSIEEAIDSCAAMIAVLSPEYVASKYCRNEMARTRGVPIFPVMLRDVPRPIELERIQYVDFTGWTDEAIYAASFAKLLAELNLQVSQQIGPRPGPEHRYLTALIARLEAKRGISQYVELEAAIEGSRQTQHRPRPSFIDAWGLDGEFTLLVPQRDKGDAVPKAGSTPVLVESISEAAKTIPKFALVGEPGAGKTTTLSRLALDAARERMDNPRGALPLLLPLAQLADAPSPLEFVRRRWPFETSLDDALRTGSIILYMDGLNEMGGDGPTKATLLRSWLDSEAGPQRAIITCRSDDYGKLDLGLPIVVTKPMDANRIRTFVVSAISNRRRGHSWHDCSPTGRRP